MVSGRLSVVGCPLSVAKEYFSNLFPIPYSLFPVPCPRGVAPVPCPRGVAPVTCPRGVAPVPVA